MHKVHRTSWSDVSDEHRECLNKRKGSAEPPESIANLSQRQSHFSLARNPHHDTTVQAGVRQPEPDQNVPSRSQRDPPSAHPSGSLPTTFS